MELFFVFYKKIFFYMNRNTGWQKQKEKSSYFWLKFALFLANNLGRSVTRFILIFVVFYYMLSSPKTLKSCKEYWHRLKRKHLYLHSFLQMYYFATTILDRVYFLQNKLSLFSISHSHLQDITEIIQQKDSVIFVGSHLGSFDIARVLAKNNNDLGIKLKVVMDITHNPTIIRFLSQINPQILKTIFDKKNAIQDIFEMKKLLKNGTSLAFLNDRNVDKNSNTIKCTFLGKRCYLPANNIKLAIKTQKPVIFFVAIYQGGNRYKIIFKPLKLSATQNKLSDKEKLVILSQNYISLLEKYTRKYPFNWFNFYDFWQ
jgi:predicted LPLAT superfamily acyltransferase